MPEDSTMGNIIPAAVKPATVAEPTMIRMMAAMSQANMMGESPNDSKKVPICRLISVAIMICLKAPAPEMISSTIAIPDTASLKIIMISDMLRPVWIPRK